MSIHFMVSPDRGRISLFEHVTRVAQASSPAGSGTVPVRGPETGGETPPQPAGEDACATVFSATQLASHRPSHRAKTGMRPSRERLLLCLHLAQLFLRRRHHMIRVESKFFLQLL